MNSLMAVSRQMKSAAALAALLASTFTTGGTLALADHYASSGADAQLYAVGGSAALQLAPFSRQARNERAAIAS